MRDYTTENIHTGNTLVIGFRLAILRYGYGIPYFSILSTVTYTVTCLVTNLWHYLGLCASL